jgi:hypothetical protein
MPSAFEGLLWSTTNLRTLLPATIVMAVFAFLLGRLLRGRNERIRNIPFVVIAVAFLVLEAVKQYREIRTGYSTYSLPFHFSSVYLLVYPLAHFTRGRFSSAMKSVAAGMSAMTAQGTLLFPMTVFGNNAESFFTDFGAFHTITYHYAVVLYLFLFIALADYHPTWRRDARILILAITAFSVVSGPLANILDTNFTSFLYCSFPPVEAVRLNLVDLLGRIPTQILYGIFMYLMILGAGMFAFLLWTLLDRAVVRLNLALDARRQVPSATEDI